MSIKKIIPCMDVYRGHVVKGVKFVDFKDAADPVEIAKYYCENGADELVFLDISATVEDRDIIIDLVSKVAKVVTIPFAVGGGIRTKEDFKKILDVGASKVSINSAAVKNPDLINEVSNEFGSEKVVVAIDITENKDKTGWNVLVSGGKENTGIDLIKWAEEVEKRGAGEILLTSLDADGTKEGYDILATKAVADAVKIPVTASGGAGSMEDIYRALTEGKAAAALAASLFHFKEVDILELKKYLKSKNVEVML